jgi:tRNA(Ile)-lysidine synthase
MDLLRKCELYIKDHTLAKRDQDKILIATSGGVDSICLVDLLYRLGYSIGIAHVNHGIRTEESAEEKTFVQEMAAYLKIPFHFTELNLAERKKNEKFNIQEVARNERYAFFTKILEEHGYTKIATAHHLDDQIETFLFHFARGSGLKGLTGIPVQRDQIIRPLIECSKVEIKEYAEKQGLEYREDKSNANINYKRNYIRHEIVPKFDRISRNFHNRAKQTFRILKLSHAFYADQIAAFSNKVLRKDPPFIRIEKQLILSHPHGYLLLYELLFSFGFTADSIDKMYHHKGGNGQMFHSDTHSLLNDRDDWIIRSNDDTPAVEEYELHKGKNLVEGYGSFTISKTDDAVDDLTTKHTVYLDASKVKFPLNLRRWQAGDFFYPLGMDMKRQKLKQYFVNNKLNRFEKEACILVCSGEDIVWIIGHRMDERYKVNQETSEICVIQYDDQESRD